MGDGDHQLQVLLAELVAARLKHLLRRERRVDVDHANQVVPSLHRHADRLADAHLHDALRGVPAARRRRALLVQHALAAVDDVVEDRLADGDPLAVAGRIELSPVAASAVACPGRRCRRTRAFELAGLLSSLSMMQPRSASTHSKIMSMIRARSWCRDFAFPVLKWRARYESIYLLGTSIARPLISKACLEVAREVAADCYAHGATRQRQRPMPVSAGSRSSAARRPGAGAVEDGAVPRGVPWAVRDDCLLRAAVDSRQGVDRKKPYSSDENCLHISYEAGKLEDLTACGVDLVDFGMTVSPQDAPDAAEDVAIGFEHGVPVSVNGASLSPLQVVETLNEIGGRNGVGRIDMVENRFVGMKSRGVYEAPGMTILYDALMQIEQLAMDRDLLHLRDSLAPAVAEDVYYGFWYTAKMDALMAFIESAQRHSTGEVVLRLYKGGITVVSRTSPNSLYDEGIATMEGGGAYDQTDAEGFLRIQGLPSRVQGRVTPRSY